MSNTKRILFLLILLCKSQLLHAQFSKVPWPNNSSTPSIAWTDLSGQQWSTKSLNNKAVLINFWATWCAPCLEELPTLQTLSEISDPAQVAIITVNVRELESSVKVFLTRTGLDLPVVLDPKGIIAKSFGIRLYPSTVLIDSNGRARWLIEGVVDWSSTKTHEWMDGLINPNIRR